MTKKEFLNYKFRFAYTPDDFGAVGDGVTDDTQAFIKLFASCRNIEIPNNHIIKPKPILLIKPTIKLSV